MQKLNFPTYKVQLKNRENKPYIFDQIRKKWLLCTSEEWVRIHCLNYFIQTLGYPASWIKVENVINLYDTRKRFDLVIMDPNQGNLILVECKSPNIMLNQEVFDQIARYNLIVSSRYMMLTNGMNHYFCTMDYINKKYQFIKELPKYKSH